MLGEVKRGPILLLCSVIGVALNADSPAIAQAVSTTGLVDWFDPDAGVTTDVNGNVEIWTNQANGGRSVTTPSTATSVVAGPGGSMIRFDAPNNDGQLSYPSAGTAAYADGYTVFSVVRINVPTTDWNSFPRLWRGANDGNAMFMRKSNGTVEVKSNGAARPASSFTAAYTVGDPTADPATLGEVAILAARVTPTSQELLFNGDVVSSTASQLSYAVDNATIQIGNSVKADMGDVLVYDATASLTGLNETGLALAQKNGVGWTVSGGSPTVSGALSVPVTVAGGALTFAGSSSTTGLLAVDSGTLAFTGDSSASTAPLQLGHSNGELARMTINTTGTIAFDNNTSVGSGGGSGSIVQTAGDLRVGVATFDYLNLGNSGSYGHYRLEGGSFDSTSGPGEMNVGNGGVGVLEMTGGTMEFNRYTVIGNGGGSTGQATLTGGTITHTASGNYFLVGDDGAGRLNVGTLAGGDAKIATAANLKIGEANNNVSGQLNLNSGTIEITRSTASIRADVDKNQDRSLDLSLNGGTIRSAVDGITMILGGVDAPDRTMLFNGGVTIDTNGYDASIATSILETTGGGFYRSTGFTATPTGEAGSGFIAPPIVKVSAGSGQDAQVDAQVDPATGLLTGFVVTNPGQGYVAGDTLTLAFTGAAAATMPDNYTYTLTADDVAANGTGVFRKQGTGTLTLTAANTFTGETRIAAGTLKLASTGSLLSSLITIESGASFDTSEVAGFQLAPGQSLGGSGTFAGSILIDAGAGLVFDPGNPLTVSSGTVTFGTGFGVDDIVGLDGANISEGLYALINGTVDLTGVDNVGFANRLSIGGGKEAYFQQGSLQLVVVPEPGAMTLAAAAVASGLGFRFGRRRRRG
jgi:autotransporter-associated beta strand protein